MNKIYLFILIFNAFSTINAQNINEIKKEENKFVYGESIKLFLGDSILVETKVINNLIKDFKLVNKIADSSKTMKIKFDYSNFGMQKSSILTISNPFELTLKYKARIKYFNRDKYSETSIIPILPKIFAFEMWPEKLESIILYDFELEKE